MTMAERVAAMEKGDDSVMKQAAPPPLPTPRESLPIVETAPPSNDTSSETASPPKETSSEAVRPQETAPTPGTSNAPLVAPVDTNPQAIAIPPPIPSPMTMDPELMRMLQQHQMRQQFHQQQMTQWLTQWMVPFSSMNANLFSPLPPTNPSLPTTLYPSPPISTDVNSINDLLKINTQ